MIGSRNRFQIRKTKKVCRQQGKVQLRRWKQGEREKLVLSRKKGYFFLKERIPRKRRI